MVTQLQDVANTVAQDKISNQRLRNEEIRRRMSDNWTAPQETPTTPTTIKPVGQNATLADTYSTVLNNYKYVTGSPTLNNTSKTGQPQENTYNANESYAQIPSYVRGGVPMALGIAGQGDLASLASGSMAMASGDKAGATKVFTNLLANKLGANAVPGLGGVLSNIAGGIVGDKSASEIGGDIFNSSLGTALGMINPAFGTVYGIARFAGLDPARGLNNLFNPNKTVPESWRGTFTSSGYNPPAGSWMSSGNENYSPYGGSQYNRVGDSSSSSSSSGYSGSDSSSSYSNPASSYGGW